MFAHTSSRLVFVVAALTLGAAAFAQVTSSGDEVARVQAALQAADADAVLSGSAERVEVVLFGQGSTYRRAQAGHVLRDFFRRFPPERVAFDTRASSDDGRTAIGRYWTADGGQPLDVRILHRVSGDEWELASVRVDRRAPTGSGR